MTPEQEAAWCEKRRAIQKRHYDQNREKIAKRNKDWRKSNPEKRRAICKNHRDSNIEKYRDYKKSYYAKNPIKKKNEIEKSRRKKKYESAADRFFQLQAAAHQISTALETKTKPTK